MSTEQMWGADVALRPVAPSEVWPRLIAMAQLPPRVDLDGAYARATWGGSLAQG